MNIYNQTKDELQEIARGIANGGSIIDIAARIGVDRSTMSGWVKSGSFLGRVAKSLSSPDNLGVESLANLIDKRQHDGERTAAYELRIDFAETVRRTFPDYFAALEDNALKNRLCALADQEFNIDTLIEIEERNWRDGSADELGSGLTTPELRRAHRCKYGIKWDFGPLGCYFSEKWDATRCRVRYADKDGMSWEDQRKTFGWCWWDRHDRFYPEDEIIKVNTRPLEVARDPRLPTTPERAEKLLKLVKGGMGYLEAVAKVE